MPRRCGRRLILRADKKSVLPSISISPAAISRKPAMASSSVVLPDPDGPKIAVTRASNETSIFSSKLASGIRQRSSMSSFLSRARQPLGKPDESKGQTYSDYQEDIGFRIFAGLHEIK